MSVCGCCEGITALTPASLENRPGLDKLAYRVGTHATFFASMEAALSDPKLLGDKGNPLARLATREPSDLSIALLDAWACIADVLAFYQERIANEGYLRTATERRSVLELAKLVGYRLRPGVAASAYLAFTLDDGYDIVVPAGTRGQTVPGPGELPQSFETKEDVEARAAWNVLTPRQTAPQRIDLDHPKTYHTLYIADAPDVRVGLPILLRDRKRPLAKSVLARVTSVEAQPELDRTKITLRKVHPTVAHARLLVEDIVVAARENPLARTTETGKKVVSELAKVGAAAAGDDPLEDVLKEVEAALPLVKEAHEANASRPRLGPWLASLVEELTDAVGALAAEIAAQPQPESEPPPGLGGKGRAGVIDAVADALLVPPSRPPRSRFALRQSVASLAGDDAKARLLRAFFPTLDLGKLYGAVSSVPDPKGTVDVYALRVTSSLFGQAAPRKATYDREKQLESPSVWPDPWSPAPDEGENLLYLESEHNEITAGSFAVVQAPEAFKPQFHNVKEVETRPRAQYGLTGKSTLLTLAEKWWDPTLVPPETEVVVPAETADGATEGDGGAFGRPFEYIRQTVVHARSELLPLAEAPIADHVEGGEIDLDTAQPGLQPGRWLIVAGDRILGGGDDGAPLLTLPTAELVMLGGVELRSRLHGKAPRTWLELATPLAYVYERETVKIYGNVVDSTHGETHHEVLGSGDATQALQRFVLKQSPLTYVAAATPSGAESTLEVRVDEVRWHEAEWLSDLGPGDRKYLTETDDEHKTSVVFGDGKRGARLPTGAENVTATYRTGIGKAGNAKVGQISQLATKPLGLKEVVNPLPATGGADPDSRDAARRNAPLAVTALDRLVSVQDYEDFARLYAGIGKASAARLSDGRRQLVHVTIAGVDDIPIDPTSDLFAALSSALRLYGDPVVPVAVAVRDLLVIVLAAKVRVLPDYAWELVEPHVRAALLEAFGFERRELGQDVLSSEVLSVIQAVPGVAFVDLDTLDVVQPPLTNIAPGRKDRIRVRLAQPPPSQPPGQPILPAQLAILQPDVPDTVLLSELPQ
jgi:predicted phage baseplate assembly protein